MFNKVLTATDLLESCDSVVLVAAEIAERHKGMLYVLHVLESGHSGQYRSFVKDFKTGEELLSNEKYEAMVKKHIEGICVGVLKDPGSYETRVRPGYPWTEILRWARKKGAELIVIGPHSGRAEAKGVTRVSGMVGSTVEGVITHERCPVMIVNRFIPRERLNFKKIMVCIDFSESCKSALEFAIKVGRKYGARLFLFHTFAVPTSPRYSQDELESEIDALKQKMEDFCKEIPGGIDSEYAVWEGAQPHVEILKFARDKDIDLIAMGSHTKQKGEKWYVGSAVEQVSSRSVCPVTVVTDPKVLRKLKE